VVSKLTPGYDESNKLCYQETDDDYNETTVVNNGTIKIDYTNPLEVRNANNKDCGNDRWDQRNN
jgi:hypothetical protein